MLDDIRFALRALFRRKAVTALMVCTLAIGIAASTTVFSVADAILWHPLPFQEPARLVSLWSYSPAQRTTTRAIRLAALDAWAAKDQILEDVHAFTMRAVHLSGSGDAEAVTASVVSPGLFAALGVRPRLGREFDAQDVGPARQPVVLLSDMLWRGRFASAQDVVGRQISLYGEPHTIVGVMPPGFVFPVDSVRLWVPFVTDSGQIDPARPPRGQVVGRLRSGVSLSQAQAVAQATTRELTDRGSRVLPEIRVMPFISVEPTTTTILSTVVGAVSLLLLIAIGNAANVLLAEVVRRDTEMRVRVALGASRWDLARQVLTESVLVSALAAGVALFVAWWAVQGVVVAMPWMLTFQSLRPIGLDWRALTFTAVIAALTGVSVALAPIMRVDRSGVTTTLRTSPSLTPSKLRNGLVVGQLSVTFVLLAAAGLLANAFVKLHQQDPGFRSDSLFTVGLELSPTQSVGTAASEAFLGEVRRRSKALPGVADATVSGTLPPNLAYRLAKIETLDRGVVTGTDVIVSEARIDDGFFATLGMSLVSGRTIDDRDVAGASRVAVISRTLARQLWPDGPALSQRFRLLPNGPWLTVVGVVADVANGGFENPLGKLAIYYPRAQSDPPFFISLILRLTAATAPVADKVREMIRELDRNVPIVEINTADQVIAAANAKTRFATMLMIASSTLALLLGLIGVYGASWYSVRQRRQEIGVRVALGAAPNDILRMILSTSARLVVISIALGLAGAFAVTRALKSVLFETSPTDPTTFAVVIAGLVLAVLAASYWPARHASLTNPIDVLRAD